MGTGLTLERDKVYRARNGSLWRVVYLDSPWDGRPVVILCVSPIPDSGIVLSRCLADGKGGVHGEELDLIAEHREPREIWLWDTGAKDTPCLRSDWGFTPDELTKVYAPHIGGRAVRFREVLP